MEYTSRRDLDSNVKSSVQNDGQLSIYSSHIPTSFASIAPTYSLERHLKNFEFHDEYQYLWNSWYVEKQEYVRQLETASYTYHEYSLHDAHHSEKIVESIERLLGQERVKLLSPSDSWLILQCAYTHDLGMCVKENEKYKLFSDALKDKKKGKELLKQRAFKEYLNEMLKKNPSFIYSNVHEPDYVAAKFWDKFDELALDDDAYLNNVFGDSFSLAQFYFGQIVVDWFRSEHAQRSEQELLNKLDSNVKKDIIPAHMRIAVAKIDSLHVGGWDNVVNKLKRKQNGFNRDYIHPAFVAALLRMGDLLDMDSTRFNPYQLDYLAEMSEENAPYMIKDLSVTEFLVNPEKICITSDFESCRVIEVLKTSKIKKVSNQSETEDEMAERLIARSSELMLGWMNYIRINAQEFRHAWNDIAPKDLPGCIAVPDKLRVRINGIERSIGDFRFRYEISSKRSSQIIEGTGLYMSPLVFLRELIQNSADATKLQISRDLNSMGLLADDSGESLSLVTYLNKYASNGGAFSKYTIQLSFNIMCDEYGEPNVLIVRIEDKGIGITKDRLNKMKHIGAIVDTQLEEEVDAMPEWLKPTGDYGIGLQSVFLMADSFVIKSRPRQMNKQGKFVQLRAMFNSTRLGGDIIYFEKEIKVESAAKLAWDNPDSFYPYGTMVEVKIDLRQKAFIKKSLPRTSNFKALSS